LTRHLNDTGDRRDALEIRGIREALLEGRG
jgi:hypothetical protein